MQLPASSTGLAVVQGGGNPGVEARKREVQIETDSGVVQGQSRQVPPAVIARKMAPLRPRGRCCQRQSQTAVPALTGPITAAGIFCCQHATRSLRLNNLRRSYRMGASGTVRVTKPFNALSTSSPNAPNFRSAIVAHSALSPAGLEQQFGLIGLAAPVPILAAASAFCPVTTPRDKS